MKTKRIITVLNITQETVTAALNSISGVWQEITLAEGEREKRYRLSPYGVFPAKDVTGKNVLQLVDREAGETMAANFASLSGQLATFFRGIPIYEGHADNAAWVKENPGHKACAVGRIKAIECEDDGIYVNAVLNAAGVAMLGGEAPQYTGHSPLWRLVPVAGQPNHYRPVLLCSDALTNTPNIDANTIALNALGLGETPTLPADTGEPNEENNDMKLTPEALAALGFAPDATPTPEEISAAIVKLTTTETVEESTEPPAELAAANSRATALEAELAGVRGAAITTVIDAAVTSGRITEADKPAWITALNTSFLTESAKLANLMPVLNTRSQVAGVATRKNETPLGEGIDAMNSAVREIAAANGLNLELRKDYDTAHAMARAAKPELFRR